MQANDTQLLVQTVIEALQDKKGRDIVDVDLSEIPEAVCRHMIICTGGSPSQLSALAAQVDESVHQKLHHHALAVSGLQYAHWIAIDYADVMVHVFLQEEREFYDVEHLWADAPMQSIPNLD